MYLLKLSSEANPLIDNKLETLSKGFTAEAGEIILHTGNLSIFKENSYFLSINAQPNY